MFCKYCGKRIKKDSKFCQFCGIEIDSKERKENYPKVPEKYRIEYIGRPEDEWKRKKQTIYKTGHWDNLKLWWSEKNKYLFKNILKAIFVIGIVVLFIWGIVSDKQADISTNNVNTNVLERNFPALREPKTVIFQWEYKDKTYTLTEILYKTAYEYYNSEPKVYYCPKSGCPEGWEENYAKIFLKKVEGDNTISQIASDIKTIGQRTKLDDDQIVELTIAFVQSIPYDFEKTKVAEFLPRYPYETLYDNKGICSDKSFLAVLLLEEMDYGVALFAFDYEKHIAPAVKCPKEYSSYNSGYCFAEVTDFGFRIGEIPPIDIVTGRPKTKAIIELFNEGKEIGLSRSELKNPKIYEITDGNSYQGIIKTNQIIQRIETLEKELGELKRIISLLENEANQLKTSVDYYDQQAKAAYRMHEIFKDNASYNEYMRLYFQYKSVYANYESKLNEYNMKVDKYNNLATEYNVVIRNFYK